MKSRAPVVLSLAVALAVLALVLVVADGDGVGPAKPSGDAQGRLPAAREDRAAPVLLVDAAGGGPSAAADPAALREPAACPPPRSPEGGATLTGRVLDPQGLPAAGTSVWMTSTMEGSSHASFRQIVSRRDGRFAVWFSEPGSHRLHFSKTDVGSADSGPLELARGEIRDLGDVQLEDRGVLVGVAVFPDGRPISELLVHALAVATLPTRLDAIRLFVRADGQSVTDGQGRFRIVGLPPGRYELGWANPNVERRSISRVGAFDTGPSAIRLECELRRIGIDVSHDHVDAGGAGVRSEFYCGSLSGDTPPSRLAGVVRSGSRAWFEVEGPGRFVAGVTRSGAGLCEEETRLAAGEYERWVRPTCSGRAADGALIVELSAGGEPPRGPFELELFSTLSGREVHRFEPGDLPATVAPVYPGFYRARLSAADPGWRRIEEREVPVHAGRTTRVRFETSPGGFVSVRCETDRSRREVRSFQPRDLGLSLQPAAGGPLLAVKFEPAHGRNTVKSTEPVPAGRYVVRAASRWYVGETETVVQAGCVNEVVLALEPRNRTIAVDTLEDGR